MEIQLTEEEAGELRRVLEGTLSDMSMEIADTDNASVSRHRCEIDGGLFSASARVWDTERGIGLSPIYVKRVHGRNRVGHSVSRVRRGYVLKGRIIVRYHDHEEVLEAGDAFYMPPGHAPAAEAGTELIQISPAVELAEVEAALMKSMQEPPGS